MVAIPTDNASGGTFAGSPPNSDALLRRVSGFSVTRCARATSVGAGSLNPMWPLVPIPENLEIDAAGIRDFPFVARGTRRRDRGAVPFRKCRFSGLTFTWLNRCCSMKLR